MSALPKFAAQSELFEPAEYLKNHSGKAFFALLKSNEGSKYKSQRSYPVDSMHAVLQALRSDYDGRDYWISQAEFFAPTRRLVHVSKVGLLFADLDTYKVPLHGSAQHQCEALLKHCEKAGIPEPSIVVFSGQGLQAKWLLDAPIPQRALPRWNALQNVINEKLQDFGADKKALDASRVLRLISTINTKSGKVVEIVHHNPHAKYSFDKLAKQLLPWGREVSPVCDQLDLQLDSAGQVILLRPGAGEAEPKKVWRDHKSAKNTIGLRQFFGFQLAWDRLADLRTLARLRNEKDGRIEDGQRDTFVFLSAVFLSQATVDQNRFFDELRVLSREFVPHWTDEHVRASASAALMRLKKYVAGERIKFNGFEADPRYRFKNETLIDEKWLGVTAEEERCLLTIMSESESKRRHAERSRIARQQEGAVSRETYLSQHEQKRATARILKAQGKSWAEIATELGYKNANSARIACRP